MIAIAAHKNQCQAIALRGITHEKDCFVVSTVGAIGILRPRQRRIVADSTWNGVKDVSNFLPQIESVNQGLVNSWFRVPAQSASVQ